MKAWIVARQILGKTDNDLKALNAIQYGPVHEYEANELTIDIGDELLEEFNRLYPDKIHWNLMIETDL